MQNLDKTCQFLSAGIPPNNDYDKNCTTNIEVRGFPPFANGARYAWQRAGKDFAGNNNPQASGSWPNTSSWSQNQKNLYTLTPNHYAPRPTTYPTNTLYHEDFTRYTPDGKLRNRHYGVYPHTNRFPREFWDYATYTTPDQAQEIIGMGPITWKSAGDGELANIPRPDIRDEMKHPVRQGFRTEPYYSDPRNRKCSSLYA
jgi:hypothetical protein